MLRLDYLDSNHLSDKFMNKNSLLTFAFLIEHFLHFENKVIVIIISPNSENIDYYYCSSNKIITYERRFA